MHEGYCDPLRLYVCLRVRVRFLQPGRHTTYLIDVSPLADSSAHLDKLSKLVADCLISSLIPLQAAFS